MKQLFYVGVCSMVLLAGGVYGEVLFSDTYNRPDSTDADTSSAGMSGVLGPLVCQESYEGSGAATSIQILTNQLNLAYGPGMANMYLGPLLSNHKSNNVNWLEYSLVLFLHSISVSTCVIETFSKSITLKICRIV